MSSKKNPKETGRQLRKPEGEAGIRIAEEMNKSNAKMYDLLFSALHLQPGETLLEIGFGNGYHFPRYFAEQADITLYGLDYSDLMNREATRRNTPLVEAKKLFLQCGDALKMPYEDATFDKVIALNTIYFWTPLEDYFKEIRRILKNDGLLFIGYRPADVIRELEFTRENFELRSETQVKESLLFSGFSPTDEARFSYSKKTVTGEPLESTDICLTCRKMA